MPTLKRTGATNRLIARNSKVYASTSFPSTSNINGLFAYRDLEAGEILVEYTGDILTQKQANASKSEYLFDLWYRSRAGADTVVKKTLDGKGELAGFANHAPESIANAKGKDILPTIIDNGKNYPGRHAMVLIAKTKIPKGVEIRFNYNADQGFGGPSDSDMVRKMLSRGVTEQQLYSREFLRIRYKNTPPDRAGVVKADFMYNFISDLS